nr:palmitoyl-monogalactosyldiacylglycerol delta-7 desaturase, chloroplastic-like [Ipomoea batatas]
MASLSSSLSLWQSPAAKQVFFSLPQTCPLLRQTQTLTSLQSSPSIYTTKLGQNGFFNCKEEKSKRLSPIVCFRPASNDGEGEETQPQAAKNEQRVEFWARMAKSLEVAPGSQMVKVLFPLVIWLSLFAPFCFSWDAFGVAFGLYIITGLGITLSYHRNLSHRSFKLPKWLEYFFAYCGVHALQGDPIGWASHHRYHHQYTDTKKDPHSPIKGFWYSCVGWLYDTKAFIERGERPTNVGDLENQFFYNFIRNTYIIHPIILATLLYAIGGFPYVVWGMGVRIVFFSSITYLVNSVCHIWGNQAWNSGDQSRNNWLLALFSFGDGWHNNHHAFEYSARHGLEWWQLDITWYTVRVLQAFGLSTDVKLPTDAQKKKMASTTTQCF